MITPKTKNKHKLINRIRSINISSTKSLNFGHDFISKKFNSKEQQQNKRNNSIAALYPNGKMICTGAKSENDKLKTELEEIKNENELNKMFRPSNILRLSLQKKEEKKENQLLISKTNKGILF